MTEYLIQDFYVLSVEYAIAIKNILFSSSEHDLAKTVEKYQKKAPEPLCKQFKDRRSKVDAIKRYKDRKELHSQALFPSCVHSLEP